VDTIRQQATLGLALLGQDVVIFICSNMAAVVRAGRFSIWLLVVNFNFIFLIGQQFRADVFQIPQQRQALSVGGKPSSDPLTMTKSDIFLKFE
jgi:hypothetical protein